MYVWQSNTGQSIEVLGGHTDTVNAVAWNPIASRRIFASCSDDLTMSVQYPWFTLSPLLTTCSRIWQTPGGLDDSEVDGMAVDTDANGTAGGRGTSGEGVEAETERMVL